MHLSSIFAKIMHSTEEDKQRQAAALERAKQSEMARAQAEAPLISVAAYTNLTRPDARQSDWSILQDKPHLKTPMGALAKWTPDKDWGLFLWGGVGTGKTHMLKGLMIHWARKAQTTSYFASLNDLMNMFRADLDNMEWLKRSLLATDILVIDDFGAEKTTDFVQSELLSLIDKRISLGKPLFMSSNHAPAQLKEIYDLRILDRLQACMHFVACDGPTYRRTIAKRNYEEITNG